MLRLIQITDVHLTPQPGSTLLGVDTAKTLRAVTDAIANLGYQPDAIIATGDIAEDGSEQTYLRFRAILAELAIPVYTLPGNHDDITVMRSCLNSDSFHCISMTDLKGWRMVYLNSQVTGQSHGLIATDELTMLEQSLKGADNRPVLIALHHTPTTVCPSSGCQLHNAGELVELLNAYPAVKAVIAGHTHNDVKHHEGGHVQFTTPSTFAHVTHAQAGENKDPDDFWASHSLDGARQAFRTLDLSDSGLVDSRVYWLSGKQR